MTLPRCVLVALLPLLAGCALPAPGPAPTPGSTPASAPAAGLLVAFGDSYTEGYGATRAEAYPALLEKALGRPVLNKGVTGETAGEALRRLDRDVIRSTPDLVIVEFGVNEAFRGEPVARSLADLETIVSRVRNETNASVVLVGVHFQHFGADFDAGLHEIARRHDAAVVTDALDGIVSSRRDVDDGDPTLRTDQYHPNARGYAIVAERILPAVQSKLHLAR